MTILGFARIPRVLTVDRARRPSAELYQTVVGSALGVDERSPIERPQHCTEPLSSTAQVFMKPAVTDLAGPASPVTLTGVPPPLFCFWSPSWAYESSPQQRMLPFVSMAQAC